MRSDEKILVLSSTFGSKVATAFRCESLESLATPVKLGRGMAHVYKAVKGREINDNRNQTSRKYSYSFGSETIRFLFGFLRRRGSL